MCLCVFLFWWWIHRHLRIPLAPLSLVHVGLAKPPESNIHLELSILAQTSNTLSKRSIAEDDPQCSRTPSVLPYAHPLGSQDSQFVLHIGRSSLSLACCSGTGELSYADTMIQIWSNWSASVSVSGNFFSREN